MKIGINTSNVTLTKKEASVIKHTINGQLYEEIAKLMGISINGVRYYIKKIYKKLHIGSKGELFNLFSEGFLKKYFGSLTIIVIKLKYRNFTKHEDTRR